MAGTGKSKTSPTQLEVEQKQIRALNLRMSGLSYDRIAVEEGYASRSGAYAAVMSALDKARAEPAGNLRELMIARLDELLLATWETALAGDTEAVATVLRIEERRARLLGLERRESPVKVKLSRLEKAQDAMTVVSELLEKATTGELLPDEATKLSALVQSFMKTAELADLAERIGKLEEAQENSFERPHGRGIA